MTSGLVCKQIGEEIIINAYDVSNQIYEDMQQLLYTVRQHIQI